MASDGKVILSTALDNSGLSKGLGMIEGKLGGLKNVAKKLAGTMGVAFSVAAAVSFGKASMDAASKLRSAMIGVKSIVDGQGRNFKNAQKFIDNYVKDGLVPATDAMTAYKNLAMRGYDNFQIESVMNALKDSAAFGRQASLSMGEAITSASEGLRNENSILVDNAGITKNVSKMWEDYGRSIGVSGQALTKQQRIEAEVSGIINETRFQIGDAAKVASVYSGQLMQLSFNFEKLKIAIGDALIPLAQQILPIVNIIIVALTNLVTRFAQVMSFIFKTPKNQAAQSASAVQDVGLAIDKNVDKQNSLTKAIKETAKAQNSLGIDELNIIESDSPISNSGNTQSPTGGAQMPPLKSNSETEQLEAVPPLLLAIKQAFDDLNIKFAPSIKAWGDAFTSLKTPATDALSSISLSVNSLKKTSFEPLYKYITNEFIPNTTNAFSKNLAPVFTDIAGNAIKEFALDFDFACKMINRITNDVILPLAKIFENVFIDTFVLIKTNWDIFGQNILNQWSIFKEGIREIWENIYYKIIAPIFESLCKTFDWLWDKHLKPLWDNIISCIMSIQEMLLAIWNNVLYPFVIKIVKIFGPEIANIIKFIIETFCTFAAIASDVFGSVIRIIKGVTEFVTGVFTLDWKKAWTGISDIFSGIWDGLVAGIKAPINLIIDMVNVLIRSVTKGLNGVIDLMNSFSFDIPKWVPVFGGKKFGLDIRHISTPQIPKLAQGAVIPANREFLAVLGDQKSGTNIEAPLSTIENALQNVLGRAGEASQNFIIKQPIQILLDGGVLYTAMVEIESKQGVKIGGAFQNVY